MNLPPTLATTARILFSLSVIALALFLLSKGRFGPATADVAQAAKKPQAVPAPEKLRLFENRISQDLPIKVKIKREKEKRFRDVDNENWARDLELEVKNAGDKPIYFLFFHLDVPEAKIRDSYQSFGIVYGRVELAKWEERPTPEDVSIKPGETIVLKIEENQLRGWDQARGHGSVPKRIHGTRLILDQLSFGDGTGFEGGAPWPRQPNPSQSAYSGMTYGDYPSESPPTDSDGDFAESIDKADAGFFQPASFVSAESELPAAPSLPELECDCVNSSCRHGNSYLIDTNATNVSCYQCGTVRRFDVSYCFDPGTCNFVDVRYRWCFSTGTPFTCENDFVSPCATNPPSLDSETYCRTRRSASKSCN